MGFMNYENTPGVYYLEDSRSAFRRIKLEGGKFRLIGQVFGAGGEYEYGRSLDEEATGLLARLLDLPLDEHFLEAVAERFDGDAGAIESFLTGNDVPHSFFNRHDWDFD